jgi:hypothetical protein
MNSGFGFMFENTRFFVPCFLNQAWNLLCCCSASSAWSFAGGESWADTEKLDVYNVALENQQ